MTSFFIFWIFDLYQAIETEKKSLLKFPETVPDIDQACKYVAILKFNIFSMYLYINSVNLEQTREEQTLSCSVVCYVHCGNTNYLFRKTFFNKCYKTLFSCHCCIIFQLCREEKYVYWLYSRRPYKE